MREIGSVPIGTVVVDTRDGGYYQIAILEPGDDSNVGLILLGDGGGYYTMASNTEFRIASKLELALLDLKGMLE